VHFAADLVLKAIGQRAELTWLEGSGVELRAGRIVAGDDGATGIPGLHAGGDARHGGRDLTVEAVEDGKRAARAIDAFLKG
jgi:dihydropyrimidine dehydrogenase (NAD+) subunit PreT